MRGKWDSLAVRYRPASPSHAGTGGRWTFAAFFRPARVGWGYPGKSLPRRKGPSMVISRHVPRRGSLLGIPGKVRRGPHVGKRRALSIRQEDRSSSEWSLSENSFESLLSWFLSLRDPAAAVSRAARSDAQTLRAMKRRDKRLVKFCGKPRAHENSLAESSTAHCGKRRPNRHAFCAAFAFRHARPCAGHPRVFFGTLKEKRGWPGQARP